MKPNHCQLPEPGRFVQQVERAVLDLRRGVPVVVRGAGGIRLVAAIGGVMADDFDEMRRGARDRPCLVLTHHRLAHLGLDQPPKAAAIALQPQDTLQDAIHWAADPDAAWPAGRPAIQAGDAGVAALSLARRGLLIPAAVCITPSDTYARTLESRLASAELLSVAAADVLAHCRAAPLLRRVSEARVPLEAAPDSRFTVFREAGVMREHVAVLIGDQTRWSAHVPVRVHSACLTGDLFGSMRCDCGSQLRKSVAMISRRDGGVLLYLAQEGRGIGLANKMRAYQIQDDGLDTVDADRALGFDQDERDYAVAREMLAQLDITDIELLTNNPAKLQEMAREPIRVAARSSIHGRLTRENRRYVAAKASRTGHWLETLLSQPFDDVEDDIQDGRTHGTCGF